MRQIEPFKNIYVGTCPLAQGRKSMFKHGGDNIEEKYTSRFLGGFGGMLPREIFFKWCNLVRFGVYLDQILSLKNFKNYYFLYINFINYHFFIKNSKILFFYIKSKYFRYMLASYGVILLKKYLEAFHD